ncbi:N-acetylmuramoyl-L-alanine amidase family protein [Paenibacillus flagellatus]|uniref:N-acetylmuramoyl-L-alanine amidase n=1 Tax=Paenibacillus flagellatus TaxID=2211139 RepID=A0A2V5JZC1_9BACL|nr:N-acetylmuramoyl-L-alanine amidase [Paenibacillus flagellatus]PYI52198.1 N-acetylmuramoyl-L-alanine amidase [Paenibacillus flagellatus]
MRNSIWGIRGIVSVLCVLSVLMMGVGTVGAAEPRLPPQPPSAISGVDVLIDVGHGGVDGGTSYGDLLEKDINLAMGLRLYDRLREAGIRTALNRAKDYAPSDDNEWLGTRSRHLRDLAQRKLLIEALKPKLTVSLHINWAAKPSQRGPGVLYQFNQPSYIAAHLFADRLNALYGTSSLPYAGKTFYLLKRSPTPAVIVEMGYISNPADRAMLTGRDGQTQITEALASAIFDYLHVFHVYP